MTDYLEKAVEAVFRYSYGDQRMAAVSAEARRTEIRRLLEAAEPFIAEHHRAAVLAEVKEKLGPPWSTEAEATIRADERAKIAQDTTRVALLAEEQARADEREKIRAESPCERCEGLGWLDGDRMGVSHTCPDCKGTGRPPCNRCKGEGWIEKCDSTFGGHPKSRCPDCRPLIPDPAVLVEALEEIAEDFPDCHLQRRCDAALDQYKAQLSEESE